MQLAGELSKMNLASLIRLVRNSELSGKICLTQGVNTAFIFFENGQPIHVESDHGTGRDALLELFIWQSGSFSYIECPVRDQERSLSPDEPLERLLKEGLAYQEALSYLERLRINSRTVFKATDNTGDTMLLPKMDGRTALGDIVQRQGLSRSQYAPRLQQLISAGKVIVVEAPTDLSSIQLPDWVISRLKQDNPDVSQSIVDLVIWADRIKCWLYQVDVDLSRVIGALEEDDSAESEQLQEPDRESFQPRDPESELGSVPGASSEPDPAPSPAAEAESQSSGRPLARPPSYDF